MRRCEICKQLHSGRGRTCSRSCAGKLSILTAQREDETDWPRITGDFAGSFEGMDVEPGDGGPFIMVRPAVPRSYVASTLAWAARSGE